MAASLLRLYLTQYFWRAPTVHIRMPVCLPALYAVWAGHIPRCGVSMLHHRNTFASPTAIHGLDVSTAARTRHTTRGSHRAAPATPGLPGCAWRAGSATYLPPLAGAAVALNTCLCGLSPPTATHHYPLFYACLPPHATIPCRHASCQHHVRCPCLAAHQLHLFLPATF